MKKNQKTSLAIATLTFALCVVSCTPGKEEKTNQDADKSPKANNGILDVINNPDKFAWSTFIEISKPSTPGNPESETVWQKEWANAEDVFFDPTKEAEWAKIVGLPLLRDVNKGLPLQLREFNEMLLKMGLTKQQIKSLHKADLCVAVDSSILNETKMNKPAFDFIMNKKMFNAEGVEAMFASQSKIDAPIEAKEIKAIWKPITEAEKSLYHFVEGQGKIYGLVSLHIITKDLPNWTWATFEHKNNECLDEAENDPILKSIDRYGKDASGGMSKELKEDFARNGMPEKWNNYILRGTQTNFTTPTGEIIILGNTYTENGFVTSSSCITCHSRATVGPHKPNTRLNKLSVFESVDPLAGSLGTPNPNWFYEFKSDGSKTVKYIQTDFMWSIPFRVKRKSN